MNVRSSPCDERRGIRRWRRSVRFRLASRAATTLPWPCVFLLLAAAVGSIAICPAHAGAANVAGVTSAAAAAPSPAAEPAPIPAPAASLTAAAAPAAPAPAATSPAPASSTGTSNNPSTGLATGTGSGRNVKQRSRAPRGGRPVYVDDAVAAELANHSAELRKRATSALLGRF
jgi:hypothetical protein